MPSLALESLDPSFRQQPFYIFLAVAAVEGSGENDRHLRYMPISNADASIPPEDEDAGEDAPIPRMGPRFHLLASPDVCSEKYTSMPLARLTFRNGVFVLADDYIPPLRQVAVDSALGEQCAATLRRVHELAVFMRDRWRGMSAEERAASGQNQPGVIGHMTSALPVCQALLRSNCSHPFSLYLAFCSLAGHLAALSSEPVAPMFEPYRHNDLHASFGEVDSYINRVLSEGDSKEYFGIPMKYERGVFSAKFLPEWAGRRLILALRAPGGNEAGVTAWCESALIGSRNLQEGMRERRVLGAKRIRLQNERGLFAGAGVVLFHLLDEGDCIQNDELLEVAGGRSTTDTSVPVEIVLYVRQSGRS